MDIGANVGVWAVQLAKMAGENGKVVGFEPNPHAREVWKHI